MTAIFVNLVAAASVAALLKCSARRALSALPHAASLLNCDRLAKLNIAWVQGIKQVTEERCTVS